MSYTVDVPFYDLPLFGYEIRVSGTAEVEYSTIYGGFITRSIRLDREFVPTLHAKPPTCFPPEFAKAFDAEVVRQFEARCVEDIEGAIRGDMADRGIRRAA